MRLLDTPICENGFMGMGIGAAMTGLKVGRGGGRK
jgi:pyruvate dehydrogenase E1 component beta subunit